MRHHLLLYLSLALLTQCSKCKDDPKPAAQPEDQLPPATQTGAGTFGCLLNGAPWIPIGSVGLPNFTVTYDPGYAGGTLLIRVYKIVGSGSTGTNQYFLIGGAPINRVGSYSISGAGPVGAGLSDSNKAAPCNEYTYTKPGFIAQGSFNVSRLDQSAGIISGTFNFTLAQPGCDTIKVTHGRFDKRL